MAIARSPHPRAIRRLMAAMTAAATLVVGACGTVPGAAVEVDGVTVSTGTVLDGAKEILASASAQLGDVDADLSAQAARSQVTAIIRHQLVLTVADTLAEPVTDVDVNTFLAQYDQVGSAPVAALLGVSADMVDDATYDLLVLDRMAQQLPEDGVDVTDVVITVEVVPADTWDDAVAARVRYQDDPDSMAADAAAALAATPGLPSGEESLLDYPYHGMFGIFSAAAGEILLIPNGDGSYLVTRIMDRQERPAKLTAQTVSTAYQRAGITGQFAVTSLLLAQVAAETPVTVNARFGTFDPRIVQVVASR